MSRQPQNAHPSILHSISQVPEISLGWGLTHRKFRIILDTSEWLVPFFVWEASDIKLKMNHCTWGKRGGASNSQILGVANLSFKWINKQKGVLTQPNYYYLIYLVDCVPRGWGHLVWIVLIMSFWNSCPQSLKYIPYSYMCMIFPNVPAKI